MVAAICWTFSLLTFKNEKEDVYLHFCCIEDLIETASGGIKKIFTLYRNAYSSTVSHNLYAFHGKMVHL